MLPTEIKDLRKKIGLTQQDIADKFGVTREAISQIERGVTDLSTRTAQQYIEYLQNYGSESKLAAEPEVKYKTNAKIIPLDNFTYVRYVPIKAQAGFANSYLMPLHEHDLPYAPLPIQIKNPDAHIAFEIAGDSMLPNIAEGDIAICKPLPIEAGTILHKEKLFIVALKDTGTEGAVICKRLAKYNQATGECLFVSDNPGYPSYEINIKQIAKLFYIKQIIHIKEQ